MRMPMAPTVYREGPFRFFFFSDEGSEPAHVHIQAGGSMAKVWLHDCTVAQNQGFAEHELNQITRTVKGRAAEFREAWDDFFAGN
jgi:hypothetical protein